MTLLTTRWIATRLVGPILIASLLLAACAGEDGTAAPGQSTTATSSEVSAPPSTSAPPPTTSATTASAPTTASSTTRPDRPTTSCPPMQALPEGARDVSRHAADPDGDGNPDELVTYRGVDDRWYLRVDLASGSTVEAAITAAGASLAGQPFVGAHDLDRTGDDELFTRAGSGAASDLIALWDLENCRLEAVTLEGEPAVFPVGASVAAATGLSCSDSYVDDLYFAELSSQDGQLYEGRISAYDLEDGRLLPAGGEGASYAGEDLGTVVGLHCGSLELT